MNTIPFIDMHSHVNFSAYDSDADEVMARAHALGVTVVNVGTQLTTSKKAIELARTYTHAYAIIGVHPIHADSCFHDEEELGKGNEAFVSRGEKFDINIYRELAKDPKVIALGECGLDFYRNDPHTEVKQRENFLEHITLANELGKPLMLHVRKSSNEGYKSAYLEVAHILKEKSKTQFNFHFFAGTIEEARILLDAGAYFSFTGVITFAREYAEIIKFLPIDRIMSETDCPYVTPMPHRGKRNEPAFVIEVVKKMAEIKGVSVDVMKEHIWNNAKTLFKI